MAKHENVRPALLDEALAFGGPIIVFDHVSLAFDDKVILREVSFTLLTGHTKIFLGASGAGKSTIGWRSSPGPTWRGSPRSCGWRSGC